MQHNLNLFLQCFCEQNKGSKKWAVRLQPWPFIFPFWTFMPPLIWVTWFCLPLASQCTFELYLLLFWISMSLAVFLLIVWFCGCFHSSILPALRLLTSSTEAVTAHIALWFPAPCRRQSLLAHTYSFWFFLRYANLRVFEPLFCQMPFQHFELSLLPFKKKKSCCKLQARILQNCT